MDVMVGDVATGEDGDGEAGWLGDVDMGERGDGVCDEIGDAGEDRGRGESAGAERKASAGELAMRRALVEVGGDAGGGVFVRGKVGEGGAMVRQGAA